MTRYINYKSKDGVETVDSFERLPGQSLREFMNYVRAMVREYNLAFGGGCYISQRSVKGY